MAVESPDPDASEAARRAAAVVIDEAMSYVCAAALRAVAATGVADHLAAGPRTPAELAAASGVDAGNLRRVLRLLATRGLFAEDAEGRFGLTEAGEALRSDAPVPVRAAVLMITDRTFWLPSGELTRSLTEGTSAFDDIFGMPFFDHFAQDEQTAAVFHDGMAAMSEAENTPVARCWTFPDEALVVDVGGGQGGFLKAVLRASPTVRGVLYDRAHVLAGHRLDTRETEGRWELAEGDFFTSVPPGDVHVLKRILHDWDDDQCVTVLRNCRRSLAPKGRVLVVDAVIPPGDDPHQGKTLDLLMMVSLTGRERSQDDFERLFRAAGLKLVRIHSTPTVLSIVEAEAEAETEAD
ncbi:methyltransferase [Streptomyces jumonjinensis]|uniref:SAM-dependent methyltransferase n=1 Tax=Streptomyces jumonjinensis TaxID=1945 RepID=A0A646KN43_STRJU|nr:methyltransferase [Streptomyces jumonjinensis]MQT03744.1 SAM-dependent methyltransferase [Streptomyces jumonjinensis]